MIFKNLKTIHNSRTIALIFSVLIAAGSKAQIVSYTSATNGALNSVAANATGTGLNRVNGATAPGSPCGTGFSSTSFSSVAVYSKTLAAVEVTAAPQTGYQLNVTGFSAGLRRSATGPANLRYAYSTDGGVTWIDEGSDYPNPSASCGSTTTFTWTTNVSVSYPSILQFRIYGFNASSSAGTEQILNLSINGTVTASCIPPTLSDSVTNILCNGNSSGAVKLTVTGGASPYTYSWSNSATTQNISNLSAGTYTVTVKSNGGCSSTASAVITAPAALAASPVINNNASACANIGNASVTPGGGVMPYTYLWSDALSQTTAAATGLSAGTYTVTVTDNNGCTASASATITAPAAFSTTATTISNATACLNSGSATSAPLGGASPYTYLWSDASSQTTATAIALSAGTYTVTVTDSSGCADTASAVITAPAALTASTVVNNNASACADNGNTSVIPGGGTMPYTYLWNDAFSQTTATATGLSAGTYSVTVTDSSGCTATASTTITVPAAFSASATTTDNATACLNSGIATAAPLGGANPYTYLWSDAFSQTTAAATALSAGTYTVTVTDSDGCTLTASATITAPAAVTASAITIANATGCIDNGSASVTPGGGAMPYTYLWSDASSQTTAAATGLSAGTYTVAVTDSSGCSASASAIITAPVVVSVSGMVNNNATACINNGSASANPSGGILPYTYLWSDAFSQTTATATGLAAGTYTVFVTDSAGCAATTSVTITAPAAVTANGTVTSGASACADNGSALATPIGGTAPYTYLWSDASSQTTASATLLSAGTYTIVVTDNDGCAGTASVTITAPAAIALTQHSVPSSGNCNGSAWISTTGGTSPYTYIWSPGGQITDSISQLCAGNYCCIVTDASGCMDNICINVITGIGQINNTSSIHIYPDPNKGTFTVSGLEINQTVEVYNYLGEKISSTVAARSAIQFDISNKPDGIYFIRIIDNNEGFEETYKIEKIQ